MAFVVAMMDKLYSLLITGEFFLHNRKILYLNKVKLIKMRVQDLIVHYDGVGGLFSTRTFIGIRILFTGFDGFIVKRTKRKAGWTGRGEVKQSLTMGHKKLYCVA